MGTEEAIEELRRCSGTQFDPNVVERLVEILQQREPKALPVLQSANRR
jgi:HD-GYP domain-containing protein (c-di-GMP phosphodiesterase class II)